MGCKNNFVLAPLHQYIEVLEHFLELYSIPLCGCIMMKLTNLQLLGLCGRVSYFAVRHKTLMSSLSCI